MVAGKRLTPVVKHPYETSFDDVIQHHVLGEAGQPESGQCGVERREAAAEHPLPVNTRVQRVSIPLEFPGQKFAMRGQPHIL